MSERVCVLLIEDVRTALYFLEASLLNAVMPGTTQSQIHYRKLDRLLESWIECP